MSIHIDSGAYHSAFENLSWKFVLAGLDGVWIRIYSQKIDISISKLTDSKWRIEIHEIKLNGNFLTVNSYSQTIKPRKHKFSR